MDRVAPPTLASLAAVLRSAAARRVTGDLRVRERDGRVHRIVLRAGAVVAAHAAGRFDPILEALRRDGALTPDDWQAALEALGRSERRAGQLAMELAGVPRDTVRAALAEQTRRAVHFVLERGVRFGVEAWVEQREVGPAEVVTWLEPGALLAAGSPRPRAATGRRVDSPREVAADEPARRTASRARRAAPGTVAPPAPPAHPSTLDRRALRQLAFALHPDRNAHLPAGAREALAARLAEATAAFHRLD